jgi:hypothetical protein
MVVLPELTQTPLIRCEDYGPQHSLKEEWVFLEEEDKFFWSLN